MSEAGHEVIPLKQLIPPFSADPDVIALAATLDAILPSNDKDFADITLYPPANFQGIVVLRITSQSEDLVHHTLVDMLLKKDRESLRGFLVVIRGNKIRMRR